ncbi:hypothetical protein [Priestia megaterium]|uniref:hypothetical protein n=1 Tax=Priestia megaterium TaxID=1404 RepID=UPI000BFC3662|nr:hypothetical protein [Priestia megaterium]PGQ79680.1 hypothetical protein COA18_27910 [Priestia megaterium]
MKTNKKLEDKNPSENKKDRGRPTKHNDLELKTLALEVKKKLRGVEITYSLLERETGIGRNTWSRRLAESIQELNKPVYRPLGLTDSDEVYFPNIRELFELYGHNREKIISELEEYEQDYYKLFEDFKKLKEESVKAAAFEQKIIELEAEIESLKEEKSSYKKLYENAVISGNYHHLREGVGVSGKVLNFEKDIRKNSDLTNLQDFFPSTEEIEETSTIQHEEKARKNQGELNKLFPNLLKGDE